jgi:hypothetical protein
MTMRALAKGGVETSVDLASADTVRRREDTEPQRAFHVFDPPR